MQTPGYKPSNVEGEDYYVRGVTLGDDFNGLRGYQDDDGLHTFTPTVAQFQNFPKFLEAMEHKAGRYVAPAQSPHNDYGGPLLTTDLPRMMGVVKVVMPREW